MMKELKGYHVLLIAVGGFGIVIAANLAMLFAATGTFPGLVVKNSYVASQEWNKKTAAQIALGWHADLTYSDGTLTVRLTDTKGAPVADADLTVTVGRPTRNTEDKVLTVTAADGAYTMPVALAPGRWRIAVSTASGPAFRKSAMIEIAD